MAEADLSRTEADLSRTEADPSRTEDDPSRTEADLSRTEDDPSRTEDDLSRTEDDPSRTEDDPSRTEDDLSRTEADLSRLPGLVLVQLFQMLPVSDRGRLACCSSRLSDVINCRAAWTDVIIALKMEAHTDWSHIIKCEDHLSSRDWAMIQKYKRFFRNVKVVTRSGNLEKKAFDVLLELCGRQVMKNLTLDFSDMFPFVSKTGQYFDWLQEIGLVSCPQSFPPAMREPPTSWVLPAHGSSSVGDVIERLGPHASLSIKFPCFVPRRNDIPETTDCNVSFEILVFMTNIYKNLLPPKCRSLLKRLELSTNSVSEAELGRLLSLDSLPTAQLISSLTSFEELHVNIVNLSEELLLELSGASGKRSPLRKLVIRQLHSRYITLPQLSSSAWGQLTQASPALTVECYIRVPRLPMLSDFIKPETPLVRLEVVCSTSDEQCLLQLYQLCADHSSTLQHLTLSVSSDVTQSTAVQEGLKKLVQACPRLQHFQSLTAALAVECAHPWLAPCDLARGS